jgi:hypothetical protein
MVLYVNLAQLAAKSVEVQMTMIVKLAFQDMDFLIICVLILAQRHISLTLGNAQVAFQIVRDVQEQVRHNAQVVLMGEAFLLINVIIHAHLIIF